MNAPSCSGFAPRTAGRIVIDWPNYGNGYLLECATNVPTVNWTAITNEPVAQDGHYVVTNLITAPKASYRLRKP